MTTKDVIAMAREAGAVFNVLMHGRHDNVVFTSGELERFAVLVGNAKLVESLDSIRRYGLDTLSGRTDGPDDRDWQRQAVNEMTKRATAALSAAKAVQPDFSDQATIAGLESSIGHLSSLVNEQLLLLEEVNDNLGVDGIGVELDDDQSPTIAKVRAHLAAMAPPVQPQAQGEAVAFLCDGTRFKVRQNEGDEAARIYGLPSELNGRWVALVAADDDCHLKMTPPQASEPAGCTWTQQDDEHMPGTWASSCGELWSFIDGGPKDNRVSYCHHCGGKVNLAAPEATK